AAWSLLAMLMSGSQAIGGADSCMRLPPVKVLGTSRSNSGQHCYRRIISRIHSALNAERSCECAAPSWRGQVSTFRLGGSHSHGLALGGKSDIYQRPYHSSSG